MGVLDRAAHHHAHGETFALATVVRTVSVTAAKAGAKALIKPDGSIEEGWIGGGCARMAVLKAARQCMLDGQSRLISIAPSDARCSTQWFTAHSPKIGVVARGPLSQSCSRLGRREGQISTTFINKTPSRR